jgi:hypothetical protein
MKKKRLILDNNGKGTHIVIPPGYKFIKIKEFEASGDFSFEQALGRIDLRTNLENKATPVRLDEALCKVENGKLIYVLNQNIPINRETSFNFRHMETGGFSGRLTLHYELFEIPEILLSNPEEDFQTHLDNYDNAKIVFSAPFGSGKSYFLDYFFNKRESDYEVFKVYPVNYSVASNEDIFKYIKADLLFQLMGKDVEFEKEGITFFNALQEYIYLNPLKTLSNFVLYVSKLHPKTELIGKSIDSLKTFLTPFAVNVKQYQDSQGVDDLKRSLDFIQALYESEGSLYEDNVYTQIIRQLLERLKEKNHKKSVLIIEDLDRMDPEHIFRILNVISAHYDTFKFGFSDQDENSHNKFGFDKIVVVCDVNNIKAIFEHRFGEKADFAGYFNKFFSTKPFEFKNVDFVKIVIRQEIEARIVAGSSVRERQDAVETLLFSLVEGSQLSLREFKQFNESKHQEYSFDRNHGNHFISKGLYTKPLFFLAKFLGFEELKKRITSLKNKMINIEINYPYYSLYLLASLAEFKNQKAENGPIEVYYKSTLYFVDFDDIDYVYLTNPSLFDSNLADTVKKEFDNNDFYDLLLLNIEKMKLLKLAKR